MQETAERSDHRRAWSIVAGLIILAICDGVYQFYLAYAVEINDLKTGYHLMALTASVELYKEVKGVYPQRWEELYPEHAVAFGPPSFRRAISRSHPEVDGYRYTYFPSGSLHGYQLTAAPLHIGQTGSRSFFADEHRVIHHCSVFSEDAWATEADPIAGVLTPPACRAAAKPVQIRSEQDSK